MRKSSHHCVGIPHEICVHHFLDQSWIIDVSKKGVRPDSSIQYEKVNPPEFLDSKVNKLSTAVKVFHISLMPSNLFRAKRPTFFFHICELINRSGTKDEFGSEGRKSKSKLSADST